MTRTVANNLFKLMVYKDEYEVARLYPRPEFAAALQQQFEGAFTLRFHLAPPFMAKPGPEGAAPRKLTFGPWMIRVFALLAWLKFVRGTRFDLFGYTEERKMERRVTGCSVSFLPSWPHHLSRSCGLKLRTRCFDTS